MRATDTLPEGYEAICSVNLQSDRKMAVFIYSIAVVITVLMVIPAQICVPIANLFSMENGTVEYIMRLASIAVLMIAYIILHELVHGIAMRLCGTKKVKFGFTVLYAYAGSDDFYGKGAYVFIALAPVVLWGAVLALLNFLVPIEWFWVIYLIQIVNLSGAAGDFFVTVRFIRLPRDILVRDSGVSMTVYSKTNNSEA